MSMVSSRRASASASKLLLLTLLCIFIPPAISRAAQPAAQPSLPKLSTQIQTLENAKDKENATTFLNQVLTPALDGLMAAIDNPKNSVVKRVAAIESLRTMGPNAEMATGVLAIALTDADPNVRLAAVRALSSIGPKAKLALPQLLPLLKDPNEDVKIVTASLIEQLGLEARKAIPNLIEALDDPNKAVHLNVIYALTVMGSSASDALPALTKGLDDENPEIKKATIIALSRMGKEAKSAVKPLAEILQSGDRATRMSAAAALGSIGPDAVDAVQELERLLLSPDPQLRSLSAFALGSIGEPAAPAVARLTTALGDSNKDVRLNAAGALGRIGAAARPSLPQLVKNLQDANVNVRQRTSVAIRQIAGKLQDKVGTLNRRELINTTATLKLALPILEDSSQGFNEEVLQDVRRSATVLEQEKSSRPFDRLSEWTQHNLLLALILIYVATAPGFWLLVLWLRPLWILQVNNTLAPYTDFEVPLPTGNSIKIPMRFILFLGWFHYHPRVLDAWVEEQVEVARLAFAQKSTVNERDVHIPIPVILQGQTVAELSSQNLHNTFGDGRQCLLIWGEGGSGKTSLACQLARWAMSDRKPQRLARHRMLPVLVEQELDFKIPPGKDPFRESIRGQLQALVDSAEPISDAFLERLLRLRRVLVIVDHFSELSEQTRAAIRPGHADFPANALIVTSRAEEPLDRVPKSVIKPLRIEGNRLSSFLEAYLIQCDQRALFPDTEYFDACSQLSKMVGHRNVTVLLAKLYAEQMITMKQGGSDGFLPDNIPDLMLSYLNELNRDRNDHEPENRRVHQITKIVAWECLKSTYRPAPAKREAMLAALRTELNADETTAIAWLYHLENRLRIIHTMGPAQDQICFALDPLAECLAALYWVEHHGTDVAAWSHWLMQADAMHNTPHSIQGLLLAMRDCCLHRSGDLNIPEFVLDELGRRVGLSTELLRQSQVSQRMARLSPKILEGESSQRLRSLRELGELGTAAKPLLPMLLRALEDKEWPIRQAATQTIGAIGAESRVAIPALIERLLDDDRRVACEAIASLGKVGLPAIPALIQALDADTSYIRSGAAWVLSGFEAQGRSAVPALVNALNDQDWQVRWVSAYALGCIGVDAKPAVFALIDACKGDYVLVAKEASRALWRINGEAADTITAALGETQRTVKYQV
jgi:HEAT repeat protein